MLVPRIRTALAASADAPPAPARRFSKIEIQLPSMTSHDMHCDKQV